MLAFTVDDSRCTRCKECVRECPSRVIQQKDKDVPLIPADVATNCIGCQHCLAICPTGAISILGKSPEDSAPWPDDKAASLDALERRVRGRRSTRRFKAEDVDRGLIDRLLTASQYAPTGANRTDLTFRVIDSRERLKELRQVVMEALQSASEEGRIPEHMTYLTTAVPAFFKYRADLIFRKAPHLLLVSAGTNALCPQEDVTIALTTFDLLASAAGLGTVWCGMLKMALETLPELKPEFGLASDDHYYAILFGNPVPGFHRSVQRDDAARVMTL